MKKINDMMSNPAEKKAIQDAAFQSALDGIKQGRYEKDPLLPILQTEIEQRIEHFKGLSPEEEGKLLSLSKDQRRIVADNDRKAKNEYLATAP